MTKGPHKRQTRLKARSQRLSDGHKKARSVAGFMFGLAVEGHRSEKPSAGPGFKLDRAYAAAINASYRRSLSPS